MLTGKSKRFSKKSIVFISTLVVFAAIVTTVFVLIYQKGYRATSMRLLRVEGTVNIETANGGTKPVIDNIRFQSGDALNTGADGLASVGLDDTKIITLQNDSRAEFTKEGKHLELKLTKGAVFFNVTEKLQPDETFEIKTSTMTAGIRGTSGYVYYDDSGRDSLIITDGVVEVSATNPVTGETKTAKVEGGNGITVYLYSDREEDTIEFTLEEVGVEDLNDFTVQMIANNDELLNRVCDYTGWDKEALKDVINNIPSTTPTPSATPVPSGTQTPTQTMTPTPSPTVTPAPTGTSTPAPTKSPSTTPTAAPTSTSTPTPGPTATTTPKPTATVTPKPTATVTPKPTATVTPKPTATTTPKPTPSTIPEPSPVPDPESTIPEGFGKYDDAWATEYKGHDVYVCKSGDSYKGWYNYKWVDLNADFTSCYTLHEEAGSTRWVRDETFTLSDGSVYCFVITDQPLRVIVFIDPDLPDGYKKVDSAWDVSYNGRTVYMGYKIENQPYAVGKYIGWYNEEWVTLDYDENEAMLTGRWDFYVSGTDTLYYSYELSTEPETTPTPESGYSIRETCWNVEYDGNTIFIEEKTVGDTTTYRGYKDGAWIDLTDKAYAGNGWCDVVYYSDFDNRESYYREELYHYDVKPVLIEPDT